MSSMTSNSCITVIGPSMLVHIISMGYACTAIAEISVISEENLNQILKKYGYVYEGLFYCFDNASYHNLREELIRAGVQLSV